MRRVADDGSTDSNKERGNQRWKNIAMAAYTVAIIAALIAALVYLYVTHRGGEPHGSTRHDTNAPTR